MGNIELKHRQKCSITVSLAYNQFIKDFHPTSAGDICLCILTDYNFQHRSWKMGGGVGLGRGAIEAEWGCMRDRKRSQSLTITSKVYSRVILW